MDFNRVFGEASPLLIEGIKLTVTISLASLAIGMLIGFFICVLRRSKFVVFSFIARAYLWIIRGTPMLVQAFIVYFGVPQVLSGVIDGFRMEPYTAGLITLSLNAGAYISEIFRGGIEAVNKGQIEASRSLGLSSSKTMLKVVLPQAVKISIPALVNQFIITVKDTSILSAIGLAEIVNRAKVYVGKSYQFFATYLIVALYYLIAISVLMIISNYLEKKFNYERTSKHS